MSNSRGKLIGQILILFLWLACKSVLLLVRSAGRLTAAGLPRVTSGAAALSLALMVGFLWMLGIGVLAALFGNPSFTLAGFIGGACFGSVVAFGVGQRGWAEAAAAAGGVELGERRGLLGVPRPHVISRTTRLRHVAVYGATGSGKSTVIKNLVLQDVGAPQRPGLLCIDLKDDLVLDIAEHLPHSRLEDVVLFDPSDSSFPPAFNPLADVPVERRTLAAAELLSALKRLHSEAWGPRLEHILRHTLLTLLETPEATLLDIARILTDPAYREWAVGHATNFVVQQFWEREFPAIVGTRGSLTNVQPLLNKLGVLAYPEVRNVLGQSRRGLDLRAAMDTGQIVLAHLPQGILGEDASNFLAALLIGKVQLAAQSRVALSHPDRKPFYVFADEFQNYETSAFDKLITEGRSMGVGLVAACQFREQVPQQLRLALERNCAYALNCRLVNSRHALQAIKQQEPEASDFSTLLRPLPPPQIAVSGRLTAIRAQSRVRLAEPRAVVEAAIARRMDSTRWSSVRPNIRPKQATGVMASPELEPTRRNTHAKETGYGRFYE